MLYESYLDPEHRCLLALQGQLNAVWNHNLSDQEAAVIRGANMPVMVIHGRHDLMAAPKYGEILAARYPTLHLTASVTLLTAVPF